MVRKEVRLCRVYRLETPHLTIRQQEEIVPSGSLSISISLVVLTSARLKETKYWISLAYVTGP